MAQIKNVVVAGTGGIGGNWLQAVKASPNARLAAALEPNREFWSEPDITYCATPEEALDREVQLLVVAAPPAAHVPLARQAVERGVDVILEKPLCRTWEEALEFSRFMDGRSETVWVGQIFRFGPNALRAKRSLGPDGIGTPLWMDMSHRMLGPKQMPHFYRKAWRCDKWSLFIDEVAIHFFDLARYLLEAEPVAVSANAWNPDWCPAGEPDSLHAIIELSGNRYASLAGHYRALGYVTGYGGEWQLETDRGCLCSSKNGVTFHSCAEEPGTLLELPDGQQRGFRYELEAALAHIPMAESHLPTLEDNMKTFATARACRIAIAEKRRVRLDEVMP